jgi:Transglutaminase-like superfamily
MSLFLKAYRKLIVFELDVRRGNFEILYSRVRNCPTRAIPAPTGAIERVCSAIDLASIWYWREIPCLQRSAATTCLLRQYGIAAQMVIGAQQVPFKAHAWVEVDGRVVNDKPYTSEIYCALDRC